MSIFSIHAPQVPLRSALNTLLHNYMERRTQREQALQERADGYAAAGAKYLDMVRPQWAREVSGTRIVISSYTNCMLGHLFGSYSSAVALLGIDEGTALRLGFAPCLGFWSNHYYRKAWEAQIAMRT